MKRNREAVETTTAEAEEQKAVGGTTAAVSKSEFETEQWYLELLKNKTFLYGEKTEYSFEKPRTEGYLAGGLVVNAVDVKKRGAKSCLLTKCNTHFVKGPYDLTNANDLVRVRKLVTCLAKLHLVGWLNKSSDYKTASVVLENAQNLHTAWFLYGFGGHKGSTHAVTSATLRHWLEYKSHRRIVQSLVGLMLKRLLGVQQNDLEHIIAGPSGDRVMLFGLDSNISTSIEPIGKKQRLDESEVEESKKKGKVEKVTEKSDGEEGESEEIEENREHGEPNPTVKEAEVPAEVQPQSAALEKEPGLQWATKWFDVTPKFNADWLLFEKCLKNSWGPCTEYVDLWRERVAEAFGAESAESTTWCEMQKDLQSSLLGQMVVVNKNDIYDLGSNPKHFGWPVHTGQRVMFSWSSYRGLRKAKDLIPGTVLPDSDNKLHAPLDPTCMGTTFRCVCPDDNVRSKLPFERRHSDRFMAYADYVRPMTNTETLRFKKSVAEQKDDEDDDKVVRTQSYTSYFVGDVVKVYKSEVNYAQPRCMDLEGFVRRDEARIHGEPDDIGLVVAQEKGNEYWKQVYCWKANTIKSINCSHMYWLANDERNGRALHIPNAKTKLEEDAPRKLLRLYQSHFAAYIE